MSILVAQAQPTTPDQIENLPPEVKLVVSLIVLIGPFVSIALAWTFGLLKRGSVVGPERLGEGESAWNLLFIFLAGLGATIVSISLLLPMLGAFPEEQGKLIASVGGMIVGFVVLLVLNGLRHDGARRIGLKSDRILSGLVDGALGLVIIVPWVVLSSGLLQFVLDRIGIPYPREHDLFRLWKTQEVGPTFKLVAMISAVVVAPLTEEVAFRGFLQTIIRRLAGRPWPAVLLTSALFAMIHEPWTIKLPIFVLSLGLGYAYERTGNLWLPIFMHALFNGSQFYLFLRMQQV